jgi:GntR family transcriptional regulator
MATAFNIDTRDPMPLYAQLERAIRFAIMTGRLVTGAQLPTVRQLAVDLRINANTVARVYAELERAGVVETRRGVGTFVREQAAAASLRHGKRENELSALTEKYLAEAAVLGFSPEELLEHLEGRVREGA